MTTLFFFFKGRGDFTHKMRGLHFLFDWNYILKTSNYCILINKKKKKEKEKEKERKAKKGLSKVLRGPNKKKQKKRKKELKTQNDNEGMGLFVEKGSPEGTNLLMWTI